MLRDRRSVWIGEWRFYTLSDGEYQDQLQPLKKFMPKLAKLQRRLARKKKFSSNWKKASQNHQVAPQDCQYQKGLSTQVFERYQQKPTRSCLSKTFK